MLLVTYYKNVIKDEHSDTHDKESQDLQPHKALPAKRQRGGPDSNGATGVNDDPVDRRKIPGDTDASNEGAAEGECGANEGNQKSWVVSELNKTIQGIFHPVSIKNVEVGGNEVEDNKKNCEN